MQPYQPRKVEFREVIESGAWTIKVYTITKTGDFDHPEFYENVQRELPKWLSRKNSLDATHDHAGFLILHAGTEGIFSLVNWWVGTNMLNTHIFLTVTDSPAVFTQISGDGLAPCVWELAVINHERVAWTNHVLKQSTAPDFSGYLGDVFNGTI